MATLNDAILARTGGPTQSDGLRKFYLDHGAVDGALQDLERQMLLVNGAGPRGTNQDLWGQYLRDNGYHGSLNDMLLQFWAGVGNPLDPDWTAVYRFSNATLEGDQGRGPTLDFVRNSVATVFDYEGVLRTVPI
ncbi:unnamed protein product, partial [marine sediment metagenome]